MRRDGREMASPLGVNGVQCTPTLYSASIAVSDVSPPPTPGGREGCVPGRLVLEQSEMRRQWGVCRQQLQRSDGLRLQGQHALDDLKHEFEALTRDLAAEHLPPWPPAIQPQPLGIGQAPGSRAAHVFGSPNSDRLANVLSRCFSWARTEGFCPHDVVRVDLHVV